MLILVSLNKQSFSAIVVASAIACTTGQACDHHICNYSSELENYFTPEDVGSADSGIDLQAIMESVKGGKSLFGKSRQEQAEYRRKAFELIQEKAAQGSVEIKNTFMRRHLLREPEEAAEVADYVYSLPPGTRVPTLEEHFVQNQVPQELLPIYRPTIMLNCEHDDLEDDEYLKLLDLYRSCLLSKKAITEKLVL